jgi:ERCC4-related helicase
MMTKGTRDEAFHWSAHHKENKMKEVLYEMQKGQTSVDSFGDEKKNND